jgi:hypothetical protein
MTVVDKHMPVLDDQFHLHTCLLRGRHFSLYAATHVGGREALIKLTGDPDSFFDELSRFYGADSSHYVSTCQYNYPPAVIGGQQLPMNVEPETLLDTCDRGADAIGALVLEGVQGEPMSRTLRESEPLEWINDLLEVTYALRELAELGVAVGDLRPEHIYVDRESDEVKIITFGACDTGRKGLSPELAHGAEADPASDIYMFGAHFLKPLARFGPLARLAKRCMRRDPADRPSLAAVQRVLKDKRKQLMPKRNLEILVGLMRPLNLAAWAVVVSLCVVLAPMIRGDREGFLTQRIDLLREPDLSREERVRDLRELLRYVETEEERAMLIDDIAGQQTDAPVKLVPEIDSMRPLAIFTCREAPMVIGREDVYRLGDWVRISGSYGYIAAIEFNRIKLSTGEAFSWHLFEKPSFFTGGMPAPESAMVWDNPNNLGRIIAVVAETMGLELIDQRPPQHRQEGKLLGDFEVASLDTFLDHLEESVAFTRDGNRLVLADQGLRIPIHRRFSMVRFNGTVEKLAKVFIEDGLGCNVAVNESIRYHSISVNCYNVTWQGLLEAAGVTWSVQENPDGKKILLESYAPSKGD